MQNEGLGWQSEWNAGKKREMEGTLVRQGQVAEIMTCIACSKQIGGGSSLHDREDEESNATIPPLPCGYLGLGVRMAFCGDDFRCQ